MNLLALNAYNLPYPFPLTSPIHPITMHFVIATVIFSVLFDALGVLNKKQEFFNIGWWNLLVALAAVIVAAFMGQLEAGPANQVTGVEAVFTPRSYLGWSLVRNCRHPGGVPGVLCFRDPLRVSGVYLGGGFGWVYGLHVKSVVEAGQHGGLCRQAPWDWPRI